MLHRLARVAHANVCCPRSGSNVDLCAVLFFCGPVIKLLSLDKGNYGGEGLWFCCRPGRGGLLLLICRRMNLSRCYRMSDDSVGMQSLLGLFQKGARKDLLKLLVLRACGSSF